MWDINWSAVVIAVVGSATALGVIGEMLRLRREKRQPFDENEYFIAAWMDGVDEEYKRLVSEST